MEVDSTPLTSMAICDTNCKSEMEIQWIKWGKGGEDDSGRNKNTPVSCAASMEKAPFSFWMQRMDYQAKAI